jgi:hypothetical protein
MSKRSTAESRYAMSEREIGHDGAATIQKADTLQPVDLYDQHTSTIVNMFMRLALPLLEPTRYDVTLKKFPNYFDLWGSDSGASASSNGAARSSSMATADVRKGWGAYRN